jgi:hypothetical protein
MGKCFNVHIPSIFHCALVGVGFTLVIKQVPIHNLNDCALSIWLHITNDNQSLFIFLMFSYGFQ